MRIEHGVSFETVGGVWRKERLDCNLDEYPEALGLVEDQRVPYVVARLEQKLLMLRWMFGNLTADQYSQRFTGLETMCEAWLHPAPAVETQSVSA